MDATIEEIARAVLSAMEESRYGDLTLKQYRMLFGQLGRFAPDGAYTPEVGAAFAAVASGPRGTAYGKDTLRSRERVARICDAYIATGKVDLSRLKGVNPPSMPGSPELLDALGEYAAHNADRGLAESTRSYYERLAREFALFAESRGFGGFGAMPAGTVLEFVGEMRAGRWAGTSAYHLASNFRPFLRFLGREDMVQALTMARQPRERHVLPVIEDADEEAIARACLDGSVSPRDAAITLLALTTGMRSCDIVDLELGDIDWRSATITTTQRKTGNPVTVPLAPAVAESIGRYVLEHRPESASRNVFLSSRAPFGPLKEHACVYGATRRAFAAAGVEGGGTLLMRHNAASKMVRDGAELPVVAAVLGHVARDSSCAYIESDEERMRMCVMPLADAAAGCSRPFPLGNLARPDGEVMGLCVLPLPETAAPAPAARGLRPGSDEDRMRLCVVPLPRAAAACGKPLPRGCRGRSDAERMRLCTLPLPKGAVA